MRILITGGDGQVGRALQKALVEYDVVALSHEQLNVADAAAVEASVEHWRPGCVVNAAALTDTTLCERDPALADAVNGGGPANMARAGARVGARLVAISTNEVFDGTKRVPYAEDDLRNPVNAYGRSKLVGERAAHDILGGTEIIVRTSWVYGERANNYVAKALAAGRSGRPLRYATDEIATPTSAADLAGGIRELIERKAPGGVYHLTNSGEASRYEWTCEILRLAGVDTDITPVTTAELRANGYDGPRKPPHSALSNTRAAGIGITLRPWREALAAHFERAAVRG